MTVNTPYTPEQPYGKPYSNQNDKCDNSLTMKWVSQKYSSTNDPNVWGSSFWFVLHNGAASYPIKASPIAAQQMKGFILGIPIMLPCHNCKEHATAHIENNYHKLDNICSGRNNLFEFFVDFHNYVNKRYGKPIMSYEDAYKLYTGSVTVTKLIYS